MFPPQEQPIDEFWGVLRITNQQALEAGGIPFGDAGRRRHDRRNAAADRLVDRQPVRFVPRWMNDDVEAGKNRRHVGPESEEMHPAIEMRFARSRFPDPAVCPAANDNQIGVPIASRTQLEPRGEETVEAFATIAQGPDKTDERAVARSQRGPCPSALVARRRRKPRRIASVVDHFEPVVGDAQALGHVTSRSTAVADDDAGFLQGLSFVFKIDAARDRSLDPALNGLRFERGVQVMHPVGSRNPAVASVDDSACVARTEVRPFAYAGAGQERPAKEMTAQRPPDRMKRHARHLDEIGPGAMRDQVNFGAARRQVFGERVVRDIHSAKWREIARHNQPGFHERRSRCAIAPCSAPSRNQNCRPTCVTNGTKLKTSASVPMLTAATVAAQYRSSRTSSFIASRHSYQTAATSAPM